MEAWSPAHDTIWGGSDLVRMWGISGRMKVTGPYPRDPVSSSFFLSPLSHSPSLCLPDNMKWGSYTLAAMMVCPDTWNQATMNWNHERPPQKKPFLGCDLRGLVTAIKMSDEHSTLGWSWLSVQVHSLLWREPGSVPSTHMLTILVPEDLTPFAGLHTHSRARVHQHAYR